MTGPPTVPGWNMNPGPLNLEESAVLGELTMPDTGNQQTGLL